MLYIRQKKLLQTCNYEETALNSLLLLEDMAKGYSEEFKSGDEFEKFANDIASSFNIQIKRDMATKKLSLFNLDVENAGLSPGQQYLLRIAVACYRNIDNDKMIFLLDEPELHLHPQALIELIKNLRSKFKKAQFWISTHSLSLISYLTVAGKNTTVLYLKEGKTDILRSNSSALLEGLIGSKENLFAIQQLMATPDEYACNKFAAECYDLPKTLSASGNDPQTELMQAIFKENDVVIDYGAGKGRFFEELALTARDHIANKIKYYAYDFMDTDAGKCKDIMSRYGSTADNYYNDLSLLMKRLESTVDYVLLVNVLHEIEPKKWREVFEGIRTLLKDGGKLIIVEREELTVGEAPYDNGFLMITENGAKKLFGEGKYEYHSHPVKQYIVKYIVEKEGLYAAGENVEQCIGEIKSDALNQIKMLKHSVKATANIEKYRLGIKLAFFLHQYANASLILEDINSK